MPRGERRVLSVFCSLGMLGFGGGGMVAYYRGITMVRLFLFLALLARFCAWGSIISVLLMKITSNCITTPVVITLRRGCQYAPSARF